MRTRTVIGVTVVVALVGTAIARSVLQPPAIRAVDEKTLREYTGVYQWGPDAFVYLQIWNELGGKNELVAIDDSGEVRTLYPTDVDRFFTGPGAAVATSVESRVEFARSSDGTIASLSWTRGDAPPRVARRVDIERHEEVRFANRDVKLAGTLISPRRPGPHPAVILVHGSGAAPREQILPFARFLVRHGVAVLAYDKRGVGASSGDWKLASIEDLAGDVVAAFDHLKTRPDIDRRKVGLLGVSQAGWIMPVAAVRAKDIAFLISVSGAGVPVDETALDHSRNEMLARGMKPEVVEQILGVMRAQYAFARSGDGWDAYATARANLAAKLGAPPASFPATRDDPHWDFMRRLYFYDPQPTLRQLRTPTLAVFGELDNNILPDKNRAAWEAALKAGGHPDYTLTILPKANHLQLEARTGNNAEMPALQRFVPEYFTTVRGWLAKRLNRFGA